MRLINAIKAFWVVLCGTELVDKAAIPPPPELPPGPAPEVLANKKKEAAAANARAAEAEHAVEEAANAGREQFEVGAVYTLMLLQREGRIIDFLQENIDDYDDNQVGMAVRQIHRDCAKVLSENFSVAAVFDKPENEKVDVPEDFDPSVIKLTGKVPSEPPYNGFLRHKGWRADNVHFPTRSGKLDTSVIQAAEVEFI
jgi:hypothetical protein